jgi:hypothetical protein
MIMTAKTLTGRCLCGEVSCVATGEPISTVNCHCTDCRRVTGAAFATVLYFSGDTVEISGALSSYQSASDRGTEVTRQFCANCGSQMFTRSAAWPELLGIRAGCIDETDRIVPQRNVFVSSKIPSTALDPKLPQFPRMP